MSRAPERDGSAYDYRRGELAALHRVWREYERVDLQVCVSKTYVNHLARTRSARGWLRPLLLFGGLVTLPVWLLLSFLLCFALSDPVLGLFGTVLANVVGFGSLPFALYMSTHGVEWLSKRIEHSRGPARRASLRWIETTLDSGDAERAGLEQLVGELGRLPDPRVKYAQLRRKATLLRINHPL